jgi:hypothetical protein
VTQQLGETLTQYAARISKQLEESEKSRRELEPRYDLECEAFQHLRTLGLENVTEGIISLNGEVTGQHTAKAVELHAATGFELRVVSYHYAQVRVSYRDLVRMRVNKEPEGVREGTELAVRKLMIAQRAEAEKWLSEHPEVSPRLHIRD